MNGDEEEVEIIKKEKCKVVSRKDGHIIIDCEVDADKMNLDPQEVRMVAGISEIAQEASKEKKAESDSEDSETDAEYLM